MLGMGRADEGQLAAAIVQKAGDVLGQAEVVAGDGDGPRPGQSQAHDDPIKAVRADEADGIARLHPLRDQAMGEPGREIGQFGRRGLPGAFALDLDDGLALTLRGEAAKKVGGHPHTVVYPPAALVIGPLAQKVSKRWRENQASSPPKRLSIQRKNVTRGCALGFPAATIRLRSVSLCRRS